MTISQSSYKKAFNTFLIDQHFDFALALAWNRDVSLHIARSDLKHLHARIDRRLCGKNFNKKPPDKRSRFFFAFEKVSSHIHVHSLWRLADREHHMPFMNMFPGCRQGIWNEVVSCGSYMLRPDEDTRAMVSYALKSHHKDSNALETGFSDDFLP